MPDEDFDESVRIAEAEYKKHQPDLIVGSSRGGAAAVNMNSGNTPLVLLCPAWRNWGTAKTLKANSVILHSRQDDVGCVRATHKETFMTASSDSDNSPEGINRRRLVLRLICPPVFIALFMFLPAGTWAWPKGWLFILVVLVAISAVFLVLHRVNPEVIVARSRFHAGTKGWDKILLSVYFPAMAAVLLMAALDDGRFHWFPVQWWVCGVGYALLLAGIGIVTWAEGVNKFFEVTVRIQTDRGQKVIDTGPYAIVRHPGYVGGIIHAIGMALSLGSLWALIPAGIASLVLIVRTQWEDQTLQEELNGYKKYATRVRYKLIPGVW